MLDFDGQFAAFLVEWQAAPASYRWEPGLVQRRLLDALRVLGVSVTKPGPKEPGNTMPAYLGDNSERFEIELSLIRQGLLDRLSSDAHARNRTRPVPSLLDVTRAEEAIQWPGRYLVADPPDLAVLSQRRALNGWLLCKATGALRFGRYCGARGWSERTARRWKLSALSEIASGLMRDWVPTGLDEDEVERLLGISNGARGSGQGRVSP